MEGKSGRHVKTCPRCGTPVHRIHRTFTDRVVGLFSRPAATRFVCPRCGWTALAPDRHRRGGGSVALPRPVRLLIAVLIVAVLGSAIFFGWRSLSQRPQPTQTNSVWGLIDWVGLGFNALWILGLSLNVGALSMADYRRSQTGQRFREVWAESGYQLASNIGLMLICIGLIYSARALWEQIIWGGLGLAFAWFSFQAWQARPRDKKDVREPNTAESAENAEN